MIGILDEELPMVDRYERFDPQRYQSSLYWRVPVRPTPDVGREVWVYVGNPALWFPADLIRIRDGHWKGPHDDSPCPAKEDNA